MQIDFHYFIAYAIAKEAGYDDKKCNIVAYASQFTDDNTDRKYEMEYRDFEFLIPFPDIIEDKGKRFHPVITQDVTLEARDIKTQRYVYAPFHFLPVGNTGNENIYSIKGRKNAYCTIANSKNAKGLMAEAVKSGDPYRIGVAMHTYADTFSHERFTAFEEDWNKIRGPLPPIGHAQIIHTPDVISKDWKDKRFRGTAYEEVDNGARALDAIGALFKLMKPSGNWNGVKDKFAAIVNSKNADERMELVRSEYPKCDKYDRDKWFNEALKVSVAIDEVPAHHDPVILWKAKEPRFFEIKFREGFDNSHWYKFQTAAKEQITWVLQNVKIL